MPRDRAILSVCLLFTAASFLLGINWGLPSRSSDAFLFGPRAPWTGGEIMKILGDRSADGELGADVDRNPLLRSPQPILLNANDAQRAEIVRRYRLYSFQPDEMITFMSLAGMKPRQLKLDPKLYQYGGLWMYPVGGLLAAGGAVGLIDLRTDLTYYLDHPESFGRFYVVARLYSALFGLIGAGCVWWLVKRISGSAVAGGFAVIAYAMLPVVNNMAHEAKPHLPGATLMMLAVMAATRFVDTGYRRWWILAALLCGAAPGMILSAAPIFIILPVMVLLRRTSWRDRMTILLAAAVIAVDVYFLSNPYVAKHLAAWGNVENPLRSNLANSRAMYTAGAFGQSLWDATRLLGYAATWPVIAAGVVGAVVVLVGPANQSAVFDRTQRESQTTDLEKTRRSDRHPGAAPELLMLGPMLVVLAQFAVMAAGKPGEYARFALFPAVVLLVFAFGGIATAVRHRVSAGVILLALSAATTLHGASYVWHFLLDSSPRTTRTIAADRLKAMGDRGGQSMAVYAEPAPYAVPPVDLWRWQLWLRRPSAEAGGNDCDVSISTVDQHRALSKPPPGTQRARVGMNWVRARLMTTPISWAAKPFVVSARDDLLPPAREGR